MDRDSRGQDQQTPEGVSIRVGRRRLLLAGVLGAFSATVLSLATVIVFSLTSLLWDKSHPSGLDVIPESMRLGPSWSTETVLTLMAVLPLFLLIIHSILCGGTLLVVWIVKREWSRELWVWILGGAGMGALWPATFGMWRGGLKGMALFVLSQVMASLLMRAVLVRSDRGHGSAA